MKLFVDHSAWYRVTSAELQSSGFDTSSNSDYWQLFKDGTEVPMVLNSDGSIEFFGAGSDSKYSQFGVYFLVQGDQLGQRIASASDSGANSTVADRYLLQVTERPRDFYWSGLTNGDEENWFGPAIGPDSDTNFPVELSEVASPQSNSTARVSVRLQGYYGSSHLVNIQLNNYQIGTVSLSGKDNNTFVFDVPASEIVSGVNNFVFRSSASTYDYSLIDEVSVTYERKLIASNQKIRFGVASGNSARVSGFSTSSFKVYEVLPQNARKRVDVTTEVVNGSYGFSLAADSSNREYVAVADSDADQVAKVEFNYPSTWNSVSNSADFIIVSPRVFKSAADDLAAMRNAQGISTKVVDVEDIGDEFGYGNATPDALRTFFLHASSNWTGRPGYVLLFGDSSYDYRNYLGLAQTRNFVPTMMVETPQMETSSDGWLVDFDDDGVEDLSIGRFPVATTTEAANAVAKLARYDNYSGSTSQSAALVADTYFEILNGQLESLIPNQVSTTKIERSVLGDAVMKQEIVSNAESGPTMVSYLGHGTTIGWTSASVFTSNMGEQLTNQKLSFYMLMTCLNGYMSDAQYDGFAERLVKAPNAAIAAWASSGQTYASGQISMSQEVTSRIFQNNQRIGDIVRVSKQTSSDMDARRTWNLFGDPTIVIY